MKGLARIGDKTSGICYHKSHTKPIETLGTIISSSTDCLTDNKGISRIGDLVLTDICNHIGYIITGDESVYLNNTEVARIGDKVGGDYIATIITSSIDIFS